MSHEAIGSLLTNVDSVGPDIVMFGEQHKAGSEFRKLCFSSLDKLSVRGFTRLAIEFTEAQSKPILDYCNGKYEYLAFRNALEELSKPSLLDLIDKEFLDAVSCWHRMGGALLFINSEDPTGSNLPNSRGRDEFMCRTVSRRFEKTIVLVGQGHTFVRQNIPLSHLVSVNNMLGITALQPGARASISEKGLAKAKALNYIFKSAAEKLHQAGKVIYSVAEITPGDQVQSGNYPKGIIRSNEITAPEKYQEVRYSMSPATKVAPELIPQIFHIGFDCWNAIYFNPEKIYN